MGIRKGWCYVDLVWLIRMEGGKGIVVGEYVMLGKMEDVYVVMGI